MSSQVQKSYCPQPVAYIILAVLILAVVAYLDAQSQGSIFFTKSFPRSVPAYFEVDLKATGAAIYREAPDEVDPLSFVLRLKETAAIFELAEKLDYLATAAANEHKIAFTGDKTIRLEGPTGARRETKFIHTDDSHAKAMVVWFERIAETGRHLLELERTARFDRLGVNKTLLRFQSSYNRGRIVAGDQFLPILKNIASGNKYVHIARARAASLIKSIESVGTTASDGKLSN